MSRAFSLSPARGFHRSPNRARGRPSAGAPLLVSVEGTKSAAGSYSFGVAAGGALPANPHNGDIYLALRIRATFEDPTWGTQAVEERAVFANIFGVDDLVAVSLVSKTDHWEPLGGIINAQSYTTIQSISETHLELASGTRRIFIDLEDKIEWQAEATALYEMLAGISGVSAAVTGAPQFVDRYQIQGTTPVNYLRDSEPFAFLHFPRLMMARGYGVFSRAIPFAHFTGVAKPVVSYYLAKSERFPAWSHQWTVGDAAAVDAAFFTPVTEVECLTVPNPSGGTLQPPRMGLFVGPRNFDRIYTVMGFPGHTLSQKSGSLNPTCF